MTEADIGRKTVFDQIYIVFTSLLVIPFIDKFLGRIVSGTSEILRVQYPSVGRSSSFGGERQNNNESQPVLLSILNPVHLCWLLLLDEKIGLGEAYMAGDWHADPGIKDFLTLLIRAKEEKKREVNRKAAKGATRSLSSRVSHRSSSFLLSVLRWIASSYNYLLYRVRDNTILGSRKNIHEHYDLGNEMFELFLDSSMTYSCALFDDPDQSLDSCPDFDRLEQAQYKKIDSLLDSLNLTADDHVLEIGCGWGSAAIRAVQRFGCKWTGLTISTEQLEFAQEKIAKAGLQNNIDLKLLDYRLETGKYSAICSIEMIEAVGEQFLGEYFNIIFERLTPGGRAAIQAILCPDSYYDRYRKSSDFIKKYIFPGGHLPSYDSIDAALPRCEKTGKPLLESSLVTEMARHYAHTLDHWHIAWLNRESKILSLGYSASFHRKWQFYFALCSALFTHEHINVAQIVFEKTRLSSSEVTCA